MIEKIEILCPECGRRYKFDAYESTFIDSDLKSARSSLVRCKICGLRFRIVMDDEGNIDTQ